MIQVTTEEAERKDRAEADQLYSFASVGRLSHLRKLEAESIYILREAVAEFSHPVMMYSIGKDSSVMLHLARKAFWPALPPFPLLHIDTTWKFKEMISFRDRVAAESGMKLIVHTNQQGIAEGITPFSHDSEPYTTVMKTNPNLPCFWCFWE